MTCYGAIKPSGVDSDRYKAAEARTESLDRNIGLKSLRNFVIFDPVPTPPQGRGSPPDLKGLGVFGRSLRD